MSSIPKSVVLIIDSDALTLTAMAAVLSSSGHECYCAQDGEAALKAVRGLDLDLMICDVDMDGGQGVELCRELQSQEQAMAVPLIVISAADTVDMIPRSRDAGGAYYLRKPFDANVLIDLVDKSLWMPHLVRQHTSAAAAPASPIAPALPARPVKPAAPIVPAAPNQIAGASDTHLHPAAPPPVGRRTARSRSRR